MSLLKALKLANAVPVRATIDPVQRAREKMIATLAEQKQMAEAKVAGQVFAPTHMVHRKSAEGQRVEVEALKRVRQGWFIDGNGKVFFAIRYAGAYSDDAGRLFRREAGQAFQFDAGHCSDLKPDAASCLWV